MLHERISENVHIFQSETYVQVNAGVIVGPEWVVVVDTLALPDETRAIRDFIRYELELPVRYVINTHYHADHSWGNAFFPEATVIAHRLTRQYQQEKGFAALREAAAHNAAFRNLRLVLPHITVEDGGLVLKMGPRLTVRLLPLPGHSPDGMGVYVDEEKVLFTGDAFTSLPVLMPDESDFDALVASLKRIAQIPVEVLIPGHGDIVFRGEVVSEVEANLHYLREIRRAVRQAARRKYSGDVLDRYSVEDCGKARVLLDGMAEPLHRRNLDVLFRLWYGRDPLRTEEEEMAW